MRYRVIWQADAEDQLAELWLAATSEERQLVTAAAHRIDQILRDDPISRSVPRSKSYRMLIVGPLGVTFEVRQDDGIVDLFAVHMVPPDV